MRRPSPVAPTSRLATTAQCLPVRARSGWLKPGSPDPHGARLALVLAFLAEHPEIEGVFFDFASLPQKPRSAAEDAMMGRGLKVMGNAAQESLRTFLGPYQKAMEPAMDRLTQSEKLGQRIVEFLRGSSDVASVSVAW